MKGIKIGLPIPNANYQGAINYDPVNGLVFTGALGSANNYSFINPIGGYYMLCPNGSYSPNFPQGCSFGNKTGSISQTGPHGLTIYGSNGATNDLVLINTAGTVIWLNVPTGGTVPNFPQGLTVGTLGTFTPTLNGFTIVNGTGGITATGEYQQVGNMVTANITISGTGTATIASAAGSSYLGNLPTAQTGLDAVAAIQNSSLAWNNGNGVMSADKLYTPTFAAYTPATSSNIKLSVSYLIT